MPLPYQYRDYPLMCFMTLVVAVSGLINLMPGSYQTIEITLASACSSLETCPVVKSLSVLPSTQDVLRKTVNGNEIVSLRADRSLSAKQIWQAIENMPCRPMRMIVDNREFVSQPVN